MSTFNSICECVNVYEKRRVYMFMNKYQHRRGNIIVWGICEYKPFSIIFLLLYVSSENEFRFFFHSLQKFYKNDLFFLLDSFKNDIKMLQGNRRKEKRMKEKKVIISSL